MNIPFIDLKTQYEVLKPRIQARINVVLEHGQYIMGPEVKELEEKLAAYTGSKHCITVASGTDALLISLMALDIRPGDEVITTPFTFVSTVEVIVLLGALPVFVDIEPDTCNIDPKKVEAAITPRTKAIIPVSLYGQPAEYDEINVIANRYDLPVIEDAAQSFGADYKGKKSCNLSTIGCTSFFPSKPLGCYGDGGAIFTNNDGLAETMRQIRVHGQKRRYFHTRVGLGGRMDTLQCAIVLAKFERFEWEVEQRKRIGERYNELLSRKIHYITQRSDRSSVFAQYTIFVENRDRVRELLTTDGVPTSVHYPTPLHLQPAYRDLCRIHDQLNIAEKNASSVLSLPMSPDLSEVDISRIVQSLMRAVNLRQ